MLFKTVKILEPGVGSVRDGVATFSYREEQSREHCCVLMRDNRDIFKIHPIEGYVAISQMIEEYGDTEEFLHGPVVCCPFCTEEITVNVVKVVSLQRKKIVTQISGIEIVEIDITAEESKS